MRKCRADIVHGSLRISERLDHRQDHDPDHENCWYFIDNSEEFLRIPVLVEGELAHPAHKKTVQSGEHEDQDDLCMESAGGVGAARPRQP